MKLSDYILSAAVALAVMIVLATLSGCGGGTDDEAMPGPASPCAQPEACR